MKKIFTLAFTLAALLAKAQLVITAGTEVAVSGNPEITLTTSSNIVNNSSQDFSAAQLNLILTGGSHIITGTIVPLRVGLTSGSDQILNGDMTCGYLGVSGGGKKTINSNLTITTGLQLVNGIVTPGPNGKILYTGASDGITDAGASSYIDGFFYTNATGNLNFPIGSAGLGFAPVQIETGSGNEIGIRAVNASANLTPAAQAVELMYIENSYYWEMLYAPGSFNSRIRLSYKSIIPENTSPVVVSSNAVGGQAFNIGSASFDANSVTSLDPFTESIVTIGGSTTVEIKVHDMITPFTQDGFNDELFIENIAKYPDNKVTLLDRWGVTIKEWTNFSNYSDPISPNQEPFNFASLSTGNYMVVVEYGESGQARKKKSQMVTVLKVD